MIRHQLKLCQGNGPDFRLGDQSLLVYIAVVRHPQMQPLRCRKTLGAFFDNDQIGVCKCYFSGPGWRVPVDALFCLPQAFKHTDIKIHQIFLEEAPGQPGRIFGWIREHGDHIFLIQGFKERLFTLAAVKTYHTSLAPGFLDAGKCGGDR